MSFCQLALHSFLQHGRTLSQRSARALGTLAPTLAILALLVVTILQGGFGITSVYAVPEAEGGGSFPVQESAGPSTQDAFIAAAPMTVVKVYPLAQSAIPAEEEAVPEYIDEVLALTNTITYIVEPGDSLYSIAEHFQVAAYTLFWVNGLHTEWDIEVGQELTIPPLSGVPHTVGWGETLDSIADKYGVRAGNIVGYPPNELRYPYELEADQEIFVPGGIIEIPNYYWDGGDRPPPTLRRMPGGEKMVWPTWGSFTAPFGWSRVYRGYHRGIDIANDWGTPIFAAAAGTVIESGWNSLGWHVYIDHGNGFVTHYGHMGRAPYVDVGEEVAKGDQIGIMGMTYGAGGYATGVHLHFAVLHHGIYIDPLPLLEN